MTAPVRPDPPSPWSEEAKYERLVPPPVREFERKQLFERIQRESATVGADIPETIRVQGEPVDLQSFVFEIKRRETIPPGERERVEQAKKNLRRERLQRKQRIEEADISYAEGERLAESIVGIDRALSALEQLGPVDLEAEAQAQETADRKRWIKFLKQALGQADADSSHGTSRGQSR